MSDSKKPVVLHVDDDEGQRALMKDVLDGKDVRQYKSWEEALPVLKDMVARGEAPDLIVTDNNLTPNGSKETHMRGFEFIAALRKDAQLNEIPVMLVSGDDDLNVQLALAKKENRAPDAAFKKPYPILPLMEKADELIAASKAKAKTAEAAPAEAKPVIVQVDDEPFILTTTKAILKKLLPQFEVKQYLNWETAEKEGALATPPALIITDNSLGQYKSGVQFVAEAKSNPALTEVPILMTSSDTDILQQAQKLQGTETPLMPDGTLAKPFNTNELIAEITRLVPQHQAAEEKPRTPAAFNPRAGENDPGMMLS